MQDIKREHQGEPEEAELLNFPTLTGAPQEDPRIGDWYADVMKNDCNTKEELWTKVLADLSLE